MALGGLGRKKKLNENLGFGICGSNILCLAGACGFGFSPTIWILFHGPKLAWKKKEKAEREGHLEGKRMHWAGTGRLIQFSKKNEKEPLDNLGVKAGL